ncbi:MAG: ATP-binding protein [Bryobacteraceae bacterium]|nr:ATP-binding protein [Bryobacteraceae bacterium]
MTPIRRKNRSTSWWDGLSVRWVWLTLPLAALSIYFSASLLASASGLRARIQETAGHFQLLQRLDNPQTLAQLRAVEPRLAPALDRRDLGAALAILSSIEREQVAELHAHWDKVVWLLVLFMALAVVPVLLAITHRIEARRWREVESALRNSESRFRDLFENVLEGVYQTSADGAIVAANPALVRMLGFDSERELKKVNVAETFYVQPGERERVVEKLRREGQVRNEELTLRRKDGRLITVLENARVVTDEHGRALCFEGTLTDISDRKVAERDRMQYTRELEEARLRLEEQARQLVAQSFELREARDAALQASRLKSEFVANVSHEFRTPMNGVIGMASLLLESDLSADQRDQILTIRDSADALLTLLNDILDLSRIEAGRLDIEIVEFPIRRTVEDVAELLALRAEAKGLDFLCLVDPDVPELVRADSFRLRQVLTNLLGNAIKFTHSGAVELRVSVAHRLQENVQLRFDVRDTGIGIPEEVRSRLFLPFSQADGSTSRRYGGSGLGLAISRQLVERMGGKIGLESMPGSGSTFWFTLPVIASPVPVVAALPSLGGRNVLVVDPHPTSRAALSALLAAWGAGRCEAPSLSAAAAIVSECDQAQQFHILIFSARDAGEADVFARLAGDHAAARAASRILLAPRSVPGVIPGFDRVLHRPLRESALRAAVHELSDPRPTGHASLVLLERHTAAPPGPSPLAGRGPVLLVEDNLVNQRVAAGLLKKLGIDVDVANNGVEALDALSRVRYRLVLMDCQMPELDGFQATALLRSRPGLNARIPVVALTANAMKSDRDRCLAAGMDDYLSKPVSFHQLAALLDRWLPPPALKLPPTVAPGAESEWNEKVAGA